MRTDSGPFNRHLGGLGFLSSHRNKALQISLGGSLLIKKNVGLSNYILLQLVSCFVGVLGKRQALFFLLPAAAGKKPLTLKRTVKN